MTSAATPSKKTKKKTVTVETLPNSPVKEKEGLKIRLRLDSPRPGRLEVTVSLWENGVEISSDSDFVLLD